MAVFRGENLFLSNMASFNDKDEASLNGSEDVVEIVYIDGKNDQYGFVTVEAAFQGYKCWLSSEKNDTVLRHFSNIVNPFDAKSDGKSSFWAPNFGAIKQKWDEYLNAQVLANLIHQKFMNEKLAQKLINFAEGDKDEWRLGMLYYKQIQENPIPNGSTYTNKDSIYGTYNNGRNLTGKLLTEERTWLRREYGQESEDILTVNAEVYVNANNCVKTGGAAIAGAGIALALRGGYPYNFDRFLVCISITVPSFVKTSYMCPSAFTSVFPSYKRA